MLPSLFLIVDAVSREIAPVLPYAALPIALLAAVRIGWVMKSAVDTRRRIAQRMEAIRA